MEEIQRQVNSLKNKVISLKAKRDLLQSQLAIEESKKSSLEKYLENAEKARILVQIVAEETQAQIEFQIANIVTMCLNSVFSDNYECSLHFITRRNKTECDIVIRVEGKEIDVMDDSGGVADVASFGLRVAVWSLKKSRNIQITDEPFKFLSVDLQDKCSEMLKEVSSKLNMQMIMVSHLPNIISAADKIINVCKENGVSWVKGDGS